MANANTEHSRKLRAAAAKACTQKALAEGRIRQILIRAEAEIVNEFDAILKELGENRPQAIKALCAFYRQNKA